MKGYILILVSLCLSLSLLAQPKQIIHQSFPLDEMNEVWLELNSEYEVEMWPGSEILAETKIELTNATNSIMRYLIDNKRYAIGLDTVGERQIKLVSINFKPYTNSPNFYIIYSRNPRRSIFWFWNHII